MKNVLFATTALVAMAGMANAASHAGVSFSGEMTAGYNDVIEGGLFWDAELGVEATVDFGDNVTASVEWTVIEADETGFTAFGTNDIPTITIAYDNGSLSAKLVAGDQDENGASEMWYADRDGMAVDVFEFDDTLIDFTASVEFGNFGIAATSCTGCANVAYGAFASFGSIELGLGFDNISGGTNTLAVSADAELGSFSVGVSYASGETSYTVNTGIDGDDTDPLVTGGTLTTIAPENSIGVEVGYEISSALSLDAYFARNSVRGSDFGVSATYTAGAIELSAYFDQETTVGTPTGVDVDGDGFYTGGMTTATQSSNSYGLDVAYTVSEQLTATVGVFSDGTFVYYAGIEYSVNDNISATVSYATADEISGPEFKNVITAEF